MPWLSLFLTLTCLLLPPGARAAQEEFGAGPAHERGETLRVSLLTMGPGDAVWEKFSHNAILIQDLEAGWARAYNWGIFDFGQEDFIPRLIRGTMLYKMAPFDAAGALEEYRRADRAVWAQELALTPEQRGELLAFVEWNARPENRDYRYDYYRDNCSTRVRDALDQVLDGAIRRATESDTTAHTYRWHTRRLLQTVPAAYLGIQVVLGPAADRPLTAWEEMFLPIRLMEEIREVEVPDGSGGTRPLVVAERRILESSRPPIPQAPPLAFPWFLLVGGLWGGGILYLARKEKAHGSGGMAWPGRSLLTLLAGGWAVVAAGSGALVLGAWMFTDHVFWYKNLNLFQMNPLFLLLLPAFSFYLLKGRFPSWGVLVGMALGVMAGIGFLLEAFPAFRQENGEILALTLPLNLALALGTRDLAQSAGMSGDEDEMAGHGLAPGGGTAPPRGPEG